MKSFKQLILENTSLQDNEIEIILKREFESLRIQYMKQTEIWANNYFNFIKKEIDRYFIWNTEVVNKHNKLRAQRISKFPEEPKEYQDLEKFFRQNRNIYNESKEKFVNKQLKTAQYKYESAIKKLADRIELKELNKSTLKVKTSHLGINIETILTDGIKTIKAWTITASGPIQQPHYRYLIK